MIQVTCFGVKYLITKYSKYNLILDGYHNMLPQRTFTYSTLNVYKQQNVAKITIDVFNFKASFLSNKYNKKKKSSAFHRYLRA